MSNSILIIDDHPLVSAGLKSLFCQEGWDVIGECHNACSAREAYIKAKPELIVSDLMMPGRCMVEVCEELRKEGHEFKLAFISAYFSDFNLVKVLDADAMGVISKSDDPEIIISGVAEVLKGNTFYSKEIEDRLAYTPHELGRPKLGVEILTKREIQILKFLATGLSIKEVATKIDVATSTADKHRANLMKKLDLHSQTALVRYAIREGIAVTEH
jgi:DNA-binding NarL/FixJ family response regulator